MCRVLHFFLEIIEKDGKRAPLLMNKRVNVEILHLMILFFY